MNEPLSFNSEGILFTHLYSENGQSRFKRSRQTLPFEPLADNIPYNRYIIEPVSDSNKPFNPFNKSLNKVQILSSPVNAPNKTTPLRLFNAPVRMWLFVLSGIIVVSVYEQVGKQQDDQVLYKALNIKGINYLQPYDGPFCPSLFYRVEHRRFCAGDVILAEDIQGMGHTTEIYQPDLTVAIPF